MEVTLNSDGHTAQCVLATAKRAAEIDAWKKRWPLHCTSCMGEGIKYYPATQWEPSDEEPRDCCYGIGVCPRCSVMMSQDHEDVPEKCPSCGWQPDEEDCMCPYPYECDCDNLQAEIWRKEIMEGEITLKRLRGFSTGMPTSAGYPVWCLHCAMVQFGHLGENDLSVENEDAFIYNVANKWVDNFRGGTLFEASQLPLDSARVSMCRKSQSYCAYHKKEEVK